MNLVSVSLLMRTGYCLLLSINEIKISLHSNYVGSGVLIGDYIQLLCSYPKEKNVCF